MSEAVRELRRMAAARRDFLDMVDYLRGADGFDLTGFNLLRVCMEAFSMHLGDARELLAFFDGEMNPRFPPEEVNRDAWSLIQKHVIG